MASSSSTMRTDCPPDLFHLQLIAEQGRMGWQKASGYTKRARAETAISRYKRVIGDELRSHTEERRATEIDVAVHVLNRMLELAASAYPGRRTPLPAPGERQSRPGRRARPDQPDFVSQALSDPIETWPQIRLIARAARRLAQQLRGHRELCRKTRGRASALSCRKSCRRSERVPSRRPCAWRGAQPDGARALRSARLFSAAE